MEDNTNINNNDNQQQNQQQQNPAPHPSQDQNVNLGLRTFTQEQLDAIIARERTKATKGWFSAEQMQAKDANITTLTTERDNAKAELAATKAQLESLKNEKYLAGKGVPSDMIEFYAFKIGKLVDDKKTFEQAAEEFLKDNPPSTSVRVSTGGNINGANQQQMKPGDIMNALIRGERK